MKSTIAITLLASVGLACAQSSGSVIPSGITQSCTDFLTAFNSNSTLASCTSALKSATSAFTPSSSLTTASTSAVTSALNNLCTGSVSSVCSETDFRAQLAAFSTACNTEIVSSPNDAVIEIYDTLYSVIPFYKLLCSKDDNGKYCITEPSGVSSGSGSTSGTLLDGTALSDVQKYMGTSTPNATTFESTNLLFDFLTSSMNSNELCTSCTRNIIMAWVSFESDINYAPGLSSSSLLGNQNAIYNSIVSTCGSGFLSGQVQAAGSLSGSVVNASGADETFATRLGAISVAVAAVLLGVALSS